MPSRGGYVTYQTKSGIQRWRLAYRIMDDYFGLTDWGSRTVWIDPRQSVHELADTLIHESQHVVTGCDGELPFINEIASGAATAMLKFGILIEDDDFVVLKEHIRCLRKNQDQ